MGGARHLAVIPDGNRRWARARGLPVSAGHREGLARMGPMLDAAFEQGVEVFSFWWGSPANLTRRDRDEVSEIRAALAHWFEHSAPELLRRWDARLAVHGRWRELCPELQGPIERASAAAGDSQRSLIVLMAYDGREEIRAGVQAAVEAGDAAAFEAGLWLRDVPPVDLLVRTGAADHISAGFMLWHMAEARIHFPQAMWPEYSVEQLRAALQDHAQASRRFGA